MTSPFKHAVTIYTDGACSGNPGPGGWAAVLLSGDHRKEISGAARHTTNNIMELTAAIQALRQLRAPSRVTLFSDSRYLVQGMTEWLPNWRRQGWKRREGKALKPLKNADLWQQISELMTRHRITVKHVAGHSGHPENERCDELAVAAAGSAIADGAPPDLDPNT